MIKSAGLSLALFFLAIPAWGQGVTLSDLRGAVINITAVHEEKFVRNGQPRSVRLTTTGRITVGAGKSITSQFQNTAMNELNGRSRSSGALTGKFTLDAPRQASQRYDVVWSFMNSSLVRLRVFSGGAGGQKMTIRFRRAPSGISCSFATGLAREVGVGRIQKGAEIDHAPIEILQFKQVRSSCRVSRN